MFNNIFGQDQERKNNTNRGDKSMLEACSYFMSGGFAKKKLRKKRISDNVRDDTRQRG